MNQFSLLSKNWLVWRIGRRFIRASAVFARGRLLDVGCGEQPYRGLLAPKVDRYIGLEHPATLHPNPAIDILGDAMSLPFKSGSFETVLSLQVLEHVPEPALKLAEIGRVLVPGGHLILAAPHIWSVHEAPHDYFRFTRYGLAHLVAKAGMEVVYIQAMAGFWVTQGQALAYRIAKFQRFGLQFLLVPLNLLILAASYLLDRIYCDESYTWNYICIARKPNARPVEPTD